MAFAPKPPPRPSRKLPRELENELKVGVFDQGDDQYNGDPQLIIANSESGCYGLCHMRPEGTGFIFHHASIAYATTCGCLDKMNPGCMSLQIPAELDLYRVKLITTPPYRMEPKFAAMVVMKLFLGLKVPEQLIMERESELKIEKADIDLQEEQADDEAT